MQVKTMLTYLMKRGFTEESIAVSLSVNQSTISRILTGKIQEPRGTLVNAIRFLYEEEQNKQIDKIISLNRSS